MSIPAYLSFSPLRLYRDKVRRRLGLPISFRAHRAHGRALVSYTTHPFTLTLAELLRSPHTNPWECIAIVDLLLKRGYSVDVIDWTNETFMPRKRYDVMVDIHTNLERLAPKLPETCIKIFYATGAHWSYQNHAEQKRMDALYARRGIRLALRRQVSPDQGANVADYMTTLGNTFAAGTYAIVRTDVTCIPLLSTVDMPSPEDKDMTAARNHYMFIGGGGAVHKGLDVVLEYFATHPEYELVVCGPYAAEKDFAEAYRKELFETPNITYTGRINIRGTQFKELTASCVGLVYPSCSEGQSGSVITALRAGLIPLITHASGVDVEPFGRTLDDTSPEAIGAAVQWLSGLPEEELRSRARAAWDYAHKAHTYESFSRAYDSFLSHILP